MIEKTAHVPIYKRGPQDNSKYYTMISLTCICCKLLEHIVVSSIMTPAGATDFLYPLQ